MTDDPAEDVYFFNDNVEEVNGEESIVEELYAQQDEFDIEADPGMQVGQFTVWVVPPPALPKGLPVDEVRKAVVHDLSALICSDQTGAWLVRHPPGTGKTTAFASIVECHEVPFERPVLGCAPTVSEAEALSQKTGIPLLRAQSSLNCQQMRDEAILPKDQRRLARHLASGHVGSDFCESCRWNAQCGGTDGQYRHDQASFKRKVMSKGRLPQYITTVKMLEHLAPTLNQAHDRIVIWTDEDLYPHMRSERPDVSKDDLLNWLDHAQRTGIPYPPEEVGFMRALLDMLVEFEDPKGQSPERMEDHTTQTGRVFLAKPDLVARLQAMLVNVDLGESRTHPSEKSSIHGEELPPGDWNRAMFSQAIDLVRGIFWIQISENGDRRMVGHAINHDMKALPAKHCFLQSDATATRVIWSGIWGKYWRGMLDGSPERALTVEWWPSSVSSSKDKDFEGAVVRIKNLLKKHPGRLGILTFKAWTYRLRQWLVANGHMVHMLPHKDETGAVCGMPIMGPPEARVVLGHFGAHDRGVNDYHKADLDAFLVLGSFRPPMSAIHQRAATLARLGVKLPDRGGKESNRLFPTGIDGVLVSQGAHRSMRSEDPGTNWVADYERAAHLAQSLERIRSVDRAARGQKPIPVYLYGPEASRPIIPLPIRYPIV